MATYTVQRAGHAVARYTDFIRAGRPAVRGFDLRSGGEGAQEYGAGNAHQLALESATFVSRQHPGEVIRVVRDDGTVAATVR